MCCGNLMALVVDWPCLFSSMFYSPLTLGSETRQESMHCPTSNQLRTKTRLYGVIHLHAVAFTNQNCPALSFPVLPCPALLYLTLHLILLRLNACHLSPDACQIGETVADREAEALPTITVEEPTVKMSFSVNTSPFAGQEVSGREEGWWRRNGGR